MGNARTVGNMLPTIAGFVLSMEYLEKYGIQLSVFQGHEKYEILSCGMEKYVFWGVLGPY